MQSTEEKVEKYLEDIRRARLIRNIADEMKDRGILSSAEHRKFLMSQMRNYSLDPSLLGR